MNEIYIATAYSLFLSALFSFLFAGSVVMIKGDLSSRQKKSFKGIDDYENLTSQKMILIAPGFLLILFLGWYTWQVAWPLGAIVRYSSVKYVPFYGWSMLVASVSLLSLSLAIIISVIFAIRRRRK